MQRQFSSKSKSAEIILLKGLEHTSLLTMSKQFPVYRASILSGRPCSIGVASELIKVQDLTVLLIKTGINIQLETTCGSLNENYPHRLMVEYLVPIW